MFKIFFGSILVILVGFLTFAGILAAKFYTSAEKYRTEISAIKNSFTSPASLWYGVVESVDESSGSFTGYFDDRHRPGIQNVRLRLYPSKNAVLGRQELIKENELYIGLGPLSPAKLSDMRPDMRIMVSVPENSPDNEHITAKVIIFGNPL
ncbi:MAG: hypothetical protein AAB597_01660 [Patescibacteria group bacterium]